ncbi:MAG: nicotinamidase [Balneolaceae bacterium]
MKSKSIELTASDALLLVDVQNDFCPGGALPIPEGDTVVPVLNVWIRKAVQQGVPVFASRDWHPREHLSFQERGGEWPPHCIQNSDGAAFHPDLNLPDHVIIVTKGVRFDQDQYSALDQTGLADEMQRRGIQRLLIGGLAQDVCVRATVLDACKAGFEVLLITDGTRPVTQTGGDEANKEMEQAGARLI